MFGDELLSLPDVAFGGLKDFMVGRTIERHHATFAHYHTAGNPGRGQPGENQEIFYLAIYRAIAATGTPARVCHEFLPPGDPLAALDEAFRQCAGAVE